MKKAYIKPSLHIIELEAEDHILAGSITSESPAVNTGSSNQVGPSDIWSSAIKPTNVWDKEL